MPNKKEKHFFFWETIRSFIKKSLCFTVCVCSKKSASQVWVRLKSASCFNQVTVFPEKRSSVSCSVPTWYKMPQAKSKLSEKLRYNCCKAKRRGMQREDNSSFYLYFR